jgi:hypothetical protein
MMESPAMHLFVLENERVERLRALQQHAVLLRAEAMASRVRARVNCLLARQRLIDDRVALQRARSYQQYELRTTRRVARG